MHRRLRARELQLVNVARQFGRSPSITQQCIPRPAWMTGIAGKAAATGFSCCWLVRCVSLRLSSIHHFLRVSTLTTAAWLIVTGGAR